jgi:hypothetical protein
VQLETPDHRGTLRLIETGAETSIYRKGPARFKANEAQFFSDVIQDYQLLNASAVSRSKENSRAGSACKQFGR